MKPSTIGVDYLAYEWQPSELIICHREMRHQMTELSAKIRRPNDRRTTKILESDYVRLTRYQNAVWRQMANRCTDSLGSKNAVLDPKAIQWEKEADLTWLYGPLYNTKINNVPHRRATHGLKSALKPYDPNPLSSTRSLPTRSANEVRFDPEIRRILYHSDLPPTHDSLKEKIRAKTLDDYCAEMNEGDDDDDDLVSD
ncbi:hypothetical protein CLU79DRAFT_715826 [Phycomyces nitens]|nr:hypothetical protein CLU79DRAFT_715826 [Phycomyces nitens]